MSPILGIFASSITPSLNASSYESIATVTVGAGGQSSVTFSSIPSTYKHLQIRSMMLRSTNTGTNLQVNGNTTAGTYPQHILYGDGASAAGYADTVNYPGFQWAIIENGTSTIPTVSIVDIFDYSTTTKNKTMRSFGGGDKNGSGQVYLASCFNTTTGTSAITQLVFQAVSGTFNQYSSFALYGIK